MNFSRRAAGKTASLRKAVAFARLAVWHGGQKAIEILSPALRRFVAKIGKRPHSGHFFGSSRRQELIDRIALFLRQSLDASLQRFGDLDR
jgi:hypothetical protein